MKELYPMFGIITTVNTPFNEDLSINWADLRRTAEAAAWLRAALACPSRADEGDFDFQEERTLYPLLGLALCCERMGDKAQARAYYERAGQLAPTHPSVLQNAARFCSLG